MLSVEELLGIDGKAVELVERSAGAELSPSLRKLTEIAPWLRAFAAPCDGDRCPRTSIQGSMRHGEIMFMGPVDGRLLEPFSILLRDLARGFPDLDTPATAALLGELKEKRALLVAVSATCPHCPRMLHTALSVAQCSAYIDVVVTRADLGFGPQVAQVPCLRINGVDVPQDKLGEYALAEALLSAPSF